MSIDFVTNEQLYRLALGPVANAATRNFESGFITTEHDIVEDIMNQFDEVWMGKYCKSCKRKAFCGDPIL